MQFVARDEGIAVRRVVENVKKIYRQSAHTGVRFVVIAEVHCQRFDTYRLISTFVDEMIHTVWPPVDGWAGLRWASQYRPTPRASGNGVNPCRCTGS